MLRSIRLIQTQVEEAKLHAFLQRMCELEKTGSGPSRGVACGDLGIAMGLPYEAALGIADELGERGWIEVVGGPEPPHGPHARTTRDGVAFVRLRGIA